MEYDKNEFPNLIGEDPVSNLQVLKSAAGWYIGRSYFDLEFGFVGPYSRESGYYSSEEEAKADLTNQSFEVRDCIENAAMYMSGELPHPYSEGDD